MKDQSEHNEKSTVIHAPHTPTEKAVLQCIDLRKDYLQGPKPVQVLDCISLEVMRGERVAIIGSSGSGKSTLLNLLGGLDTPTSGEVFVDGQLLSCLDDNSRGQLRNKSLGFVYQLHHLLREFTALENVAMPLLIGRKDVNTATARAREALSRVGLDQRMDHKPAELSGGERQRVAIARAIVNQPACVLMDEPTGNLDRKTASTIEALIHELNREDGTSFVIVTHDETLAATMDRTLQLTMGKLA